ncbi:NAD(P)H-hydrate dehydratase [Candidatus Gottesmanbacteria bacterium RIFCSPHIGHO2_02_FULL_39_11]|uniref:ADP-dependent (S)-NAD(P)H-hydrate dehydratase n=1 Tax=Candidatus Gottesmanbacteria bacterium RIFCSPHIGHO2_02_FULL_39_11 TaxID=1798382 RepID=A0A1F5ZLL5_9BACT|nr:MAG: NAD(P)H-hydrate dehydratase [Candidatus Gottesmanbacteria bacterium RIFCSPHIGHO2_02_FULL_39_11]
METSEILKQIHLPDKETHKGQNGKLMVIGGSHFFHAASLWSLKIATRIVDLVHYSSVSENNRIVHKLKEKFQDGIVIPRKDIEKYIEEDDAIVIGPGMVRAEGAEIHSSHLSNLTNVADILAIEDEGVQTYFLTKYLLKKYSQKKWVIDAGALQMMDLADIPPKSILTPHFGEFERLLAKVESPRTSQQLKMMLLEDQVKWLAKQYSCIVLLKGKQDFIAGNGEFEKVTGGNPGMSKGGTGDVLAGLVGALYAKNEPWVSALSASILNKRAGDDLYEKMGFWFNASDLADQIPVTMKRLIINQ